MESNPVLKRVAVLGAGTMGAQIAAHFANVGVRTLLLDLPASGEDRSHLARTALTRLSSLRPAPLYSRDALSRLEAGNFEDDLEKIGECDWVVECVVEDLEIKRALLERVEAVRRPGTIVSTNTSGLPVSEIARGRGPEFQRHWLGTHFFNPPRYMALLEIIPGESTLPEVVQRVERLADRMLGKGVVLAKDRPNFIANRIGSFAAARALELMQELDLSIEEVDALTGPVCGFPRTATFRLGDLVGLDVMMHVARNLYQNLPDDPWREHFRPPEFLQTLVERGWTGRKSGQGFYKKEEGRILALDYHTLEYRPRQKVKMASLEMARNEPSLGRRLQSLLAARDQAGAFLWPYFRDLLAYAAGRVPEIADRYLELDRAMRWGYNWQKGPFELWQALGTAPVAARMEKDGVSLPHWIGELLAQEPAEFYRSLAEKTLFFDLAGRCYQEVEEAPEKIKLEVVRRAGGVVCSNAGASLLDLGEGVACLEFHSKMNAIGEDIVDLAGRALGEVERNFLGLVIGNQGKDFSVGANLMLLLLEAQEGNWEEIDLMVRRFQHTCMSFRCSARPVVAAPFQRTLGGGTEVCLGSDAVVASAETYMGLVEVGVGLIPAGGGTKEMLLRHIRELRGDPGADFMPALREAFMTVGRARVSTSAQEARRLRFLGPRDRIEIHPERLLWAAKQRVLQLAAEGYRPPQPDQNIPVLGNSALAVFKVILHLMVRAGEISEHDARVGRALARVLCGGDLNHATTVSEQYLLDLEREAFLSLCAERKTQERIQHILKTGKPLRN